MTRITALCFALVFVLLAGFAGAQDGQLSALQQLQAENFKLKVEVAQLRATLADREARLMETQLSAEQRALVADFRTTLGAADDATFDWSSLTFTPAQTPAPAQEPAP